MSGPLADFYVRLLPAPCLPIPRTPPPDTGKELDIAEAHWAAYRKAQCSTLYDYYTGGTIRGPAYGACVQELTRRHMHELASIYADLWH